MEDQFDEMIRKRLEQAAIDPPAGAWERVRHQKNTPSIAKVVWVRLAAGLLVAGLAAAYFIQDGQTPQQVASVILSAPAPEPEPVTESIMEEENGGNTGKHIPSQVVALDDPDKGAPSPAITSPDEGELAVVVVQEMEKVSEDVPDAMETEEDPELNVEGVVLVYELPVDRSNSQLNQKSVRSGLARIARLVREVKNGEVSLGHVREIKNSMFTRDFWKEKMSKNSNQIMQ